MTNEQIVFANRMSLMKQGVIGTTGREFKYMDETGVERTVSEPEEIHTYQAWRKLGFQVRKGEKAVSKFGVWKFVPGKKNDDGETEKEDRMYMKVSAFFGQSQVELIPVN